MYLAGTRTFKIHFNENVSRLLMQRHSKVLMRKFQGHMKVTRQLIAREIVMLWVEVRGRRITVLTNKVRKVAWQDINRIIAEEWLNNKRLP